MKVQDITIFATMEDGSLRRVILDPTLSKQIQYIIPSATNNQWTVSETIYNPSTFGGKNLVVHEGVPVHLIAAILDSYFDEPERKVGFRNGVVMNYQDTYYYVYETKTTIVLTEG